MRIGRVYTFEAAHFLPQVPDGHKCKTLHGHSYRLEVEIEGGVGTQGWVIDFAELDGVVKPYVQQLDHTCLNDNGFYNPTAELLVAYFVRQIRQDLERGLFVPIVDLARVKLWETERGYAVWEKER